MRKTDEETSLASGAHPPALQVTGRGMLRGSGGGQGREEAHSQRGARICWLLVLAPGEEKYGQLLTVSVSLEMDDLLCA